MEMICLQREPVAGQVDRQNYVIRGCSLLREGPATGHDMDVDRTTLLQAKDLIPAGGLKAKINHRDAGGVLSINGRMKNPRIEGKHLRADWHLSPTHPTTPAVLSIAEEQPEDAGISLRGFTTKERVGGRTLMRFSSLKSADLVDDPAANESLLENPNHDVRGRFESGQSGKSSGSLRDIADALEDHFNITIPDGDLAKMKSVDDLQNYVKEKNSVPRQIKSGIISGVLKALEKKATDLDDEGVETALEVEDMCDTYLSVAEDHGITLLQVEQERRQKVIDDGRAPGATPDEVYAAGAELSRQVKPGLRLKGLEASSYRRGAGVDWSFTMQDFSVSPDEFARRSNVIALGRASGASELQARAALTMLEARTVDARSQMNIVGAPNPTLLIKLKAAKAVLDSLVGQGKAYVMKDMELEREFGVGWKRRLRELEVAASK